MCSFVNSINIVSFDVIVIYNKNISSDMNERRVYTPGKRKLMNKTKSICYFVIKREKKNGMNVVITTENHR